MNTKKNKIFVCLRVPRGEISVRFRVVRVRISDIRVIRQLLILSLRGGVLCRRSNLHTANSGIASQKTLAMTSWLS